MVIPVLVTFAQAQEHLRLTPSTEGSPSLADQDLQSKIDQATAIVLDYIARPTDAIWTAEIESWDLLGSPIGTPPGSVVAAVLLQLGDLYRYRGDDVEAESRRERGFLTPGVMALLHRYRDPALA
jgi:hypothetical protein